MTDFSVLRSCRTGTLITADDIDYTVGVGFRAGSPALSYFWKVPMSIHCQAGRAARSASNESYLWRLREVLVQVLSTPLAGIPGFRQMGSQVGRWPR
jgi:hypothetical protein